MEKIFGERLDLEEGQKAGPTGFPGAPGMIGLPGSLVSVMETQVLLAHLGLEESLARVVRVERLVPWEIPAVLDSLGQSDLVAHLETVVKEVFQDSQGRRAHLGTVAAVDVWGLLGIEVTEVLLVRLAIRVKSGSQDIQDPQETGACLDPMVLLDSGDPGVSLVLRVILELREFEESLDTSDLMESLVMLDILDFKVHWEFLDLVDFQVSLERMVRRDYRDLLDPLVPLAQVDHEELGDQLVVLGPKVTLAAVEREVLKDTVGFQAYLEYQAIRVLLEILALLV
uniref:uncharacterized protein n=1 Tax=Myxine glutinosa TaxID=7769 RepID=UPI00358EF472